MSYVQRGKASAAPAPSSGLSDGTYGDVVVSGAGSVVRLTGLVAGQHQVSADAAIAAGLGVMVIRYVEVGAGVTLELGADADLEVS